MKIQTLSSNENVLQVIQGLSEDSDKQSLISAIQKLKDENHRLNLELLELKSTKLEAPKIDLTKSNFADLSKRFDVFYFKKYTPQSNFQAALDLCNWCTENKIEPPELWQSLVAKNGSL
jgi:hypothetical protein